MKPMLGRLNLLILLCVFLAPVGADAKSHHGPHKPAPPKPGKFDYYVLSLSWSPEHCAEVQTTPGDSQCGTGHHYAFVVHGLWPQYEKGGYPQSCSTKNGLTPDVIQKALEIMPSETLIRHEWQKHGTCSGLSADKYFGDAREAFAGVKIPDDYSHPATDFTVTAASVRGAFRTANPPIPEGGIAVVCNHSYLTEVRVCLSKDDFAVRPCGKDVRDTCKGEVTVRRLR